MSGFGLLSGQAQQANTAAPRQPNIIENGMHRVLMMIEEVRRAERSVWLLHAAAVGQQPTPATEQGRIEGVSTTPTNMEHALNVMQQSIEKLNYAINQFYEKD